MANVLCVLYDDPVDGYPPGYARDGIPDDRAVSRRAVGPGARGDRLHARRSPRERLGELGFRRFVESAGTSSSSPPTRTAPTRSSSGGSPTPKSSSRSLSGPRILTAERIAKAPKLKLALTAGIGSDHVDLQAAMDNGITVTEVTYCNSISVAEHVVMLILVLVRDYLPAHQRAGEGGWHIADCVSRSYDLEGMQVGTVGARTHRLGGAAPAEAVRCRPPLHGPSSPAGRGRGGARRDVPLRRRLARRGLRRGDDQRAAAPGDRGALRCAADRPHEARRVPREHRARKDLRPDAVARACESGQLAGYAGDVWFPNRRRTTTRGARCRTRHDPAHVGDEPVGTRPATPRASGRSSSAGSTGARSARST